MLNFVDLILIFFIVLTLVRGWQRGFLLGVLSLAGWVGSLLLALGLTDRVATWLGPLVGWSEIWDRPAAFVLITFVVGIFCTALANVLLRRTPQEMHVSPGNRLLGILPGIINGLIFAAIIATLLLTLPVPDRVRNISQKSALAGQLAAQTDRFRAQLIPIFGDAVAETLPVVTIHPDTNQRVTLPFTEDSAPAQPSLEQQMLKLINRDRAEAGLAPLKADPLLREVARTHSADMLRRGYFGHISPDGVGPFDRISAADIPYVVAGENLAFAPTLSIAHRGLMNSPGHRANIMHAEFGRVGIGILRAGPRGLMVTQLFRN